MAFDHEKTTPWMSHLAETKCRVLPLKNYSFTSIGQFIFNTKLLDEQVTYRKIWDKVKTCTTQEDKLLCCGIDRNKLWIRRRGSRNTRATSSRLEPGLSQPLREIRLSHMTCRHLMLVSRSVQVNNDRKVAYSAHTCKLKAIIAIIRGKERLPKIVWRI